MDHLYIYIDLLVLVFTYTCQI